MLMSVENILDVTRPNDLLFVESLEVGIRWKLLDKKKNNPFHLNSLETLA